MSKFFENRAARKLGIGLLYAALIFMSVAATAQQLTNATTSTQAQYVSPVQQAAVHSKSSHKNIGILITFGTGNSVTPDEAGEWAVKQLNTYAAAKGKNYNTQYYVLHTDKGEGIAVTYLVGAFLEVGPKDIMQAKNPEVLNEVLQNRDLSARMLSNNAPDQ